MEAIALAKALLEQLHGGHPMWKPPQMRPGQGYGRSSWSPSVSGPRSLFASKLISCETAYVSPCVPDALAVKCAAGSGPWHFRAIQAPGTERLGVTRVLP